MISHRSTSVSIFGAIVCVLIWTTVSGTPITIHGGQTGPACPVASSCAYDADACGMLFRWDNSDTPCGEGQAYFMGPTGGAQQTISTGCAIDDPPIYKIEYVGGDPCGTCGDSQTMELFGTDGNSLGDYTINVGTGGPCFDPGVQIASYAWTGNY